MSGWLAAGAAAVGWAVKVWSDVRAEAGRGRRAQADLLSAELAAAESSNDGLHRRLLAYVDRLEAELAHVKAEHSADLARAEAVRAAQVAELERQIEGREREIEILESERRSELNTEPQNPRAL